uniref:AAA+ ATPase domain-containing protein n=1 Tax=Clytia hemisphaerica TaxID=252671 RepID=A0A7M5X461_9CNID
MDKTSLSMFCSKCQEVRTGKFCSQCGKETIPSFYGEVNEGDVKSKTYPNVPENKGGNDGTKQPFESEKISPLESQGSSICNSKKQSNCFQPADEKPKNGRRCSLPDEKVGQSKIEIESLSGRSQEGSRKNEVTAEDGIVKEPLIDKHINKEDALGGNRKQELLEAEIIKPRDHADNHETKSSESLTKSVKNAKPDEDSMAIHEDAQEDVDSAMEVDRDESEENDSESEKEGKTTPYSRKNKRRRKKKKKKQKKNQSPKKASADIAAITKRELRKIKREQDKLLKLQASIQQDIGQEGSENANVVPIKQDAKKIVENEDTNTIDEFDVIDLEETIDEKEEISVHFYITVPKQLAPKLKDHFVAILFSFRNNFNVNYRKVLSILKTMERGNVLLHCYTTIRRNIISSKPSYKYVMVPKTWHGNPRSIIWEGLHSNDFHIYNRVIDVKNENIYENTLYLVDDVFLPASDSSILNDLKNMVKDFLNFKTKDTAISNERCEVFETYLHMCDNKQLPHDEARPTQTIMFKKALCRGFYGSKKEEYYYQWRKDFEKLPFGNGCHKKLWQSIENHIAKSASILSSPNASEEDRIAAVTSSLGHILYLREVKLSLMHNDFEFFQRLFNGLSINFFGDVGKHIKHVVVTEFGRHKKYIIAALIDLLKYLLPVYSKWDWIEWVHPLVLIHILYNEFQGFPRNIDSRNCGLHGIMSYSISPISIKMLFDKLQSFEFAFSVDPMLEISFLFLMALEHLPLALDSGYFTLEYLLKMLAYKIKDQSWFARKDFVEVLCGTFAQIISSFDDTNLENKSRDTILKQIGGFTSIITSLGIITSSNQNFTTNLTSLFKSSIELWNKSCKLLGQLCNNEEEREHCVKDISEKSLLMVQKVNEFLTRNMGWNHLSDEEIHMELQLFDVINKMAEILKEIRQNDEDKLLPNIEKNLEANTSELYKKNVGKFLRIYGDSNLYSACTNNAFKKKCNSLLKELLSGKESDVEAIMPIIEYLEKGDGTFLKVFSQEWNGIREYEDILNSVFKSPVIVEIIKYFYDKPLDVVADITGKTEEAVQHYYQLLSKGEITIHSMQMIYPHKAIFLELAEKFILDVSVEEQNDLFKEGNRKVEQFNRLADDLKYLVEGQEDIPKLIKSMKKISKLLEKNITNLKLNELEGYFPIYAPMLPFLTAFRKHSLFGCDLFLTFFNNFRFQPKHVIKEMTLQDLFQKAIGDLFGFNKDLIKEDVQTKFIPEFFKKKSKVLEELTAINLFLDDVDMIDKPVSREQLKEVSQKIEIVLKSLECDEVSDNLTDIHTQLGLTGNFEQLQEIKFKTRQDEMKLQDIDQEYINFVENLYRSKTELAAVHEMILTNIDLIIWLKSILKDKSEIQTSVDFMKNAAGDRHREIELVKFFEEICSVLTPLIDLTNDAGFIEFQQACEGINRQMGYNTANKMLDVNNNLDWFRDAEKAGKSFATGAFMETKEANRNGKYIIGHIDETADRFLTKTATLDSAMSFEITNQKDGKRKVLNLTAIDELQSKLMLLGHANSSKDENDESEDREKQYFLKCADLARRLASVYVSLCEAGDANYFDWHFAFRCHIESSIDSFDEVEHEIEKLSQRLDKWKTELGEHRDKYPLMNMFNNKQCLVLRKYLFPLTQSNKNLQYLPPKVFTLLQLLNPKVSTKHIENAFFESYVKEADTSKDWQTVTSPNETMDGEQEETNFILFSKSEIESKMEELIETHDFDEDIVKACFVNVVPFVMKDAIKWCRLNKDKDNIYDFSEAFDDEIEKMYCPNDGSEEEIEEDYDEIQTDEAKYLELEQFGRFLSRLNKPGPPRILPDNLKRNNPTNDKRLLLILHQNEVLKSMAQIYLASGGLPHPKDILLCNDVIDEEKIELFIKLVALNQCGDVYCIAFADYLPYDLTECLLENLKKYNDLIHEGSNHLIIICTEENENQSNLRDAFEKSRVENFILSDQIVQVEIGKILKSGQMNFASAVDDDKCSARVILSERGGMGKSLYVKNKERKLEEVINKSPPCRERRSRCHKNNVVVTIPIHNVEVSVEDVVDQLCAFEGHIENVFPRIYHFDIAPLVSRGLDNFIFNVVILGYLQTQTGKAWHKQQSDLCIFEITETANKKDLFKRYLQKLLPTTICKTPQEVIAMFNRREDTSNIYLELLFDKPYQRVYQYLHYYHANGQNLKDMVYVEQEVNRNVHQLLTLFLSSCGIRDPSWLELQNFVLFFNTQLEDFETNYFASANEDFPGFKTFVLKFLLRMSKDFATRSLHDNEAAGEHMVELRKHWETEYHPYLFFNEQKDSFSFIGFKVVPNRNREGSMNLIEPESNRLIEDNVMSLELFERLQCNMINDIQHLQTDPYKMRDVDKLNLMGRVLGIYEVANPDSTYELTPDNMKKIFAIHMRLRCGIPVILMGETGCGKTRLIKYMCDLRVGASCIRNMVLIKVHGGVTALDIEEKIKRTKIIAKENMINYILYARGYDYKDENLPIEVRQNVEEEVKDHIKNKTKIRDEELLRTILFLDEANTSEAIGLIKEIMIDGTLNGKALNFDRYCIDVIAACNPYRRHSDVMIKRLESAGLGYHVTAEQSYEKFGDIPLRHLVYRVHPLPESMKPLVWDFGSLSNEVEFKYSRQIIDRCVGNEQLPRNDNFKDVLLTVLTKSQEYMRSKKNECSFVSLRDIERGVSVTSWFYRKMDLFSKFIVEDLQEDPTRYQIATEKLRKSLLLAVAVCYIAKLDERAEFIEYLKEFFTGPFALEDDTADVEKEIERFQKMFIDHLDLKDNIAKNKALCENLFMMVVCIELRIPLFIIGKPGSSKSLAKTIIQDNMQGNASRSPFFKKFKRINMTSYQCSPHSTSEGIIGVFNQAAKFQEQKILDEYTSVVVLDEVGLAEDSPKLPLKALHPLLEDGTDGSEDLTIDGSEAKHKRVSFVGISNWGLDPAKMNRGILLSRSLPDKKELAKTAREICTGNEDIKSKISPIMEPLAGAYFELYRTQKNTPKLKKLQKEEFFGLRDFYCLVKMVFCFAKACKGMPPLQQIELAVKRNFSGLEELNAWDFFRPKLLHLYQEDERPAQETPTLEMIQSSIRTTCPCLRSKGLETKCTSSRYLLIMTENYSALPMVEAMLQQNGVEPDVIFGSSFPRDQEFTQVCRDINRMKIAMETGKTIILLNMEKLYESLYDALNQYYVFLGGQSYVDLGLGTHRVKCRVDEKFRLIVVANKQVVYELFPIPLINRLEKHFLMMTSGLVGEQQEISNQLKEWAINFSRVKSESEKYFTPSDAFIGFTEDMCPSIVMQLYQEDSQNVFEDGKRVLINIATPDSIFRLGKSRLQDEKDEILSIYFDQQQHTSLAEFLNVFLESSSSNMEGKAINHFIQVTTFSRLMSKPEEVSDSLNHRISVKILDIVKYPTEFDFRKDLETSLKENGDDPCVIIVQHTETDRIDRDVVACAQHICRETQRKFNCHNTFFLFLVQLNTSLKSSVGYHSSWICTHIDDIRNNNFPFMRQCQQPLSSLFQPPVSDTMLATVKNSIQSAMKQFNNEKNMDLDKVSRKIILIQQRIGSNDELSLAFIEVTMQYMQNMIASQESLMVNASNWMLGEAIKEQNRLNYATFQASLVSCIETKVANIWAQFLNLIDINDNLLLLEMDDYQEIWMTLMKIVMGESKGLDNVDEVPNAPPSSRMVKNQHEGEPGGGIVSYGFPFSSYIVKDVESKLKASQELNNGMFIFIISNLLFPFSCL